MNWLKVLIIYTQGTWYSWNAKPTWDKPKTWASLPQVCYPTQLSIINNYNLTLPVAARKRHQFKWYWHLPKCSTGIIQKGLFWFVGFGTVGFCLGFFWYILLLWFFLVGGGGMFGRVFFPPRIWIINWEWN